MATTSDLRVNIIKDTPDRKGMPLEIEVEYKGTKHIVSGDNIKNILNLFISYDDSSLTPEALIFDARARSILDEAKAMEEEAKRKAEEAAKKLEEESKKTKEETKEEKKSSSSKSTKKTKETEEDEEEEEETKTPIIRIKEIGKKLLILVGAGVILLVGSTFIGDLIRRNRENNNDQDIDFGGNQIAIEQQVDEKLTSGPYSDSVIAPPVSISGSENLPYINGSSRDWISMTDTEYLEALNSQTIACQMNMPEISLFLEGEALEGTKQLTNIQKTFKVGSVDYCIVEYFNQFRNEIVNAAYDTQNVANTRAVLEHHVGEIYLFCTNQRSIAINTNEGVHEYKWEDLSYEAKNAILDVMFSFVIAMPHDYAVYIDGQTVYPETLAQFYETNLATLTLVNPTNKR